ncbi:MAG: GNAT family N-acetyltransferase [Verrucomicrobia bacterium]|nr:GNAT family N-acetyltransferase [Verrucomicrobiota bacterium]
MDRITLREARPDDGEFAYRVKKAAFREYVEKVWGWDEEEQRRLHEQRFESQDVRIVNVAGTDVGVMAVVTTSDCIAVNQIFLLPEHQHKGIGRRCMALVMEEARQLGVPIRLRVLKVNARAQAFFERLGFARTGETDTHLLFEKRDERP